VSDDLAPAPAGPVLGLLSRGLEVWLRQQCEGIEELEIQLQGSAAALLQGRLAGARLAAAGVRYERLLIERVRLQSNPLRVRMGRLLRQRTLELEQPFLIRGRLAFTGEGLTQALLDPRWRELGVSLAERLLGTPALGAVVLAEDHLVLTSAAAGETAGPDRAARLEAGPEGLVLRPLDGGPAATIPLDPDLQIERAWIEKGSLLLEGAARVRP
jgi:hypothetical protein